MTVAANAFARALIAALSGSIFIVFRYLCSGSFFGHRMVAITIIGMRLLSLHTMLIRHSMGRRGEARGHYERQNDKHAKKLFHPYTIGELKR